MITSRHNREIQRIRQLAASARDRAEAGLFLVEGARFLEMALAAGVAPAHLYRAEPARQPEAVARLERAFGLEATPVAREVLAWAASIESEVDLVGLFPFGRRAVGALEPRPRHVLILEAIADPGNVGAAVRSAAAAGADAVVLAGDCADWTNPKAVRASAGAVLALPVLRARGVAEALAALGLPGLGADARSETSLYETPVPEAYAVVVGHETRGLSEEARAACASLLRIPMAAPVESLNAAVAAAVLLYGLAHATAER